jgi:hypothetical protein
MQSITLAAAIVAKRVSILLLAIVGIAATEGCRSAGRIGPHHPPEHLAIRAAASEIAGAGVTVLAPEGRVREGAAGISPVDARIGVVAGILDRQGNPAVVVAWRTTDGGLTWRRAAELPLEIDGVTYTGHFDPAIAFAPSGVAYLTAVGTTPTRMVTSILVFRSTDGGATWAGVYARPVNGRTQDKPWIDVDEIGVVHLMWGEFGSGAGVILYARSTDSGATWSPAAEIRANAGWPIVAAPPVGKVVASFMEPDGSYAARVSVDGGVTFGPPVLVAASRACTSALPDVGMHQVVADDSPLATRGHLYAVYCGNVKGVLFTRSRDGGATWSAPAVVSGEADIALPAVAVDRRTGDVVVTWIDGRHAPGSRSGRLYATRSRDGGATFENPKALTSAFSVDGFVGDYNQLAASDGLALAVFSDVAGHFSVVRIGEPSSAPPRRSIRRRTVTVAVFSGPRASSPSARRERAHRDAHRLRCCGT